MQTNEFAQSTDLMGRLIRATNFALDHWWLWIVLAIAAWLFLKLRAQHALVGQLDERADAAHADIDALLLERHTLVGNLAEVVRAFANREHDVIRDVLKSRVEALEALDGLMQGETQIAGVLQNLFQVTEQYPQLASASHYAKLREDLTRIEDRITAARRFYNLAVEELNGVRRAFPANMFKAAVREERAKFTVADRRAELSEPVQISL